MAQKVDLTKLKRSSIAEILGAKARFTYLVNSKGSYMPVGHQHAGDKRVVGPFEFSPIDGRIRLGIVGN